MTENSYTCVKCGGLMEMGFMLDKRRHARQVALWYEGVPTANLLDISERRKIVILAYRCTNCGYLELWAQD